MKFDPINPDPPQTRTFFNLRDWLGTASSKQNVTPQVKKVNENFERAAASEIKGLPQLSAKSELIR